jgi:hypothetical protein
MFNLRDRLFRLSAFLQANIWIGDHRGISWLTAVSKKSFLVLLLVPIVSKLRSRTRKHSCHRRVPKSLLGSDRSVSFSCQWPIFANP